MINILIVEDSTTACFLLKSILDSDENLRVIGTARNGEEGIQKTLALNPDLVTMDIHMPGMDGFETTRRIMAQKPKPIVIVSTSIDPEDIKISFKALEAGALAVVAKPSGPGSKKFEHDATHLIETVKLMAEVKVVGRRTHISPPKIPLLPTKVTAKPVELIAMGASTGGPAALSAILTALPVNLSVPILIVQHITEGFDQSMADWLTAVTHHRVQLAQDGQLLCPGLVLFAPRGKHLGVSSGRRIVLDSSDPINTFRPSITYLFQSLAGVYGPRAVGVILTGMGSDGALGLVEFHKAGGYVIAQDEATSEIFSMPGTAIASGAVDQVLPLNDIPNALNAILQAQLVNKNREASQETGGSFVGERTSPTRLPPAS